MRYKGGKSIVRAKTRLLSDCVNLELLSFCIAALTLEVGCSLNQKPTEKPIKNEADNGVKNERGTLAMARTSDPHSATAQFFINVVDNGFLDFKSPSRDGWGYCVFGKVTEGMDVVDQIRKVATGNSGGHQDVPKENVVIKSVTVS
jgi:peptidyl-prolyl cis-trans isomerase B (cyclophilin B)